MVYQQIPIEDLEDGAYYIGRGRRGNVGLWSARRKCFLLIGGSFGQLVVKHEGYFSRSPKSGSFQPFKKIETGTITNRFPDERGDYGPSLEIDLS